MDPWGLVVKRSVGQALRECLEYRDLFFMLTQRELRSRYRRSFLGWGWSLLQPLMMTAVYVVVLGVIIDIEAPVGDPSGIDNFAVFLLAAVLPWNFFSASLTSSMGAVANAGSLVTRVWFPRELLPLSGIAAMVVTLLIELGILSVAIVLMTGKVMLHLLPVALVIVVLQVLFVSGVSLWLAACNVRFRDVEYLTTVMLLAYFYMTPILYPPSYVPDESIAGSGVSWRELSLANPMARFAMAYRNVFYDIRLPGLNTILWLTAWSTVIFFLGLRFYTRRSPRFAELM
jgi:ABC-2 type transport system permease protein